MKSKSLFLVFFFIFLLNCKKKEENKPLQDGFDASGATLISESGFSSGNSYTTSGRLKLYSKNGTKHLVFEGFKTDSGPDLRVYLSKNRGNDDFVNLGVLKAKSGDFYYSFDNSINTAEYNHVLIWCEDFSVLFGSAVLN